MKRWVFYPVAIAMAIGSATATGSGIPTVDVPTLEQLRRQYDNAVEQLQTAQDQLRNAQAQLQALTSSAGFGSAGGSTSDQIALRRALPSNSDELLDPQNSAGLGDDVKYIIDDTTREVNFKEDRVALSQQALKIEATAKAMNQRAYDSMTERLARIDELQEKIEATTNPKEIAELQARIQVEQANISAEQTRVELATRQLDAERNLLQVRARRVYGGWFGDNKTHQN